VGTWGVFLAVAIGLALIGFVGYLVGAIAGLLGAVGKGVFNLLATLFGRRYSKRAVLSEPPELGQKPWPDPRYDKVIQSLNFWTPSATPQTVAAWPTWRPLWIGPKAESHFATDSEIESLHVPEASCKPPYELLDRPPEFSSTYNYREPEPPPKPPKVPESYPAPVLTLPRWRWPFRFLNLFVEAAHADLIYKHRQTETRALDLATSAQTLNKAREEAWKQAHERHVKAVARERKHHESCLVAQEHAKKRFQIDRDADLEPLRLSKESLAKHAHNSVAQHFNLALRRLSLPGFVPRHWVVDFQQDTKTLLLEHSFPDMARLTIERVVSPASFGKEEVRKPVAQRSRKQLMAKIQPALCLRLACSMAEADCFHLVDSVAVNGWVDFFDKASGQPKRSYCASIIAPKARLLELRLATADPIAAFQKLRGANAGEAYETAPILPSLRLQTDDPRFVAPRETLAKMARGENLAAMEWEDFEHLVRELFEREFAANGAEVKITRASRDQGVDAVIFDPDPLRGGKIVIQAKRYTLPVDVSAVRDLYGTVINEGANTGILVTTSHYGPEAYEFAQNKNLKLINGAQLLGLLEKAGYRFRIDLAEARALAAKQ